MGMSWRVKKLGRKQVKKQIKLEKIIAQFNAAKEVEVVGPFRIFCWFSCGTRNSQLGSVESQ